ncbi:ATP-dependent DNA helicase PIF4 [Frankliniella fusca]|uniref:ATP-dependent DNA helicase PIF4 n=1 Tax=Frankliniella fusca TaxID=407009 RepID=A0AAE1GZ70_9NEOP|nr:ATP-dependent DNA helicase PIF4 [Frankliniella fusca]
MENRAFTAGPYFTNVDLMEEDEENDEESTVAPQFKILDLNETPSDFQLEMPHTEKIASQTEASRFPLPNLLPEIKTNPSEPFYHFISGGAGVGKSLLINSIKQVLERFWIHQPNNKPDDIHILPIAPTGKAAIGINGTTIDSAFGFGFNIKEKLRIGRMLNSDTRNTLEIDITSIIHKVITLYYRNDDVDAFNNLFLATSPNEKVVSRALDSCSGTKSKATITYMLTQAQNLQHKKTQNMQYLLKLCTETKYIVSHNIAVPDGISNGSPCILKKVIYGQLCEKGNREQIPIRAYVQFEKETTGEKTRQKLKNIIQADGIADKTWTPIQRICRSFSLNENTHIQVTRNQLPLLPSNAQTIHCSQSCTYKNILVFITKNLSRKLLYTAFSRVESLQGLHISGIYKKPIRATIENDPSLREMIRMRSEAQLQFSLTFPEEVKNDENIIALFHNVRSLNLHFPNVCSDKTLLACNIIMLAETWSQPADRYEIDNFTIVYRTDCASTKRKAFGTLIYVKSTLLPHINILFQNESISGTNHSTVVALTVCSKTVIMVYKSPKCQWLVLQQQLQQAINTSLQNNVHEIAIMGDFNIKYQVSDPNYKNLNEFMIQNNCFMILDPTKVSTDHNSLIDLCFSTNAQTNSFIFESVTSDHKPIWIELINP